MLTKFDADETLLLITKSALQNQFTRQFFISHNIKHYRINLTHCRSLRRQGRPGSEWRERHNRGTRLQIHAPATLLLARCSLDGCPPPPPRAGQLAVAAASSTRRATRGGGLRSAARGAGLLHSQRRSRPPAPARDAAHGGRAGPRPRPGAAGRPLRSWRRRASAHGGGRTRSRRGGGGRPADGWSRGRRPWSCRRTGGAESVARGPAGGWAEQRSWSS